MTLATHAIVGAAAARLFSFHPAAAFLAAFASHFLIDAIPHWDYHLKSLRYNREHPLESDILVNRDFIFDFGKMAFEPLRRYSTDMLMAFISPSSPKSTAWIFLTAVCPFPMVPIDSL